MPKSSVRRDDEREKTGIQTAGVPQDLLSRIRFHLDGYNDVWDLTLQGQSRLVCELLQIVHRLCAALATIALKSAPIGAGILFLMFLVFSLGIFTASLRLRTAALLFGGGEGMILCTVSC